MSPDKGKSQAERGANLFIPNTSQIPAVTHTLEKGKIREAQEELWVFILGKLVLPESSTKPLLSPVFP